MMNSNTNSTVLSGHKIPVILCDNRGYAVTSRLQQGNGVPGFNDRLKDCRITDREKPVHVDFAADGAAMRAQTRHCESLGDLAPALEWARANDGTTVISIATNAHAWVPGDADWDVARP